MTDTQTHPALSVSDLEVSYVVRGIPRKVLRGVDLRVMPGESYGLVGESGCGKSTTAYAAVRYLPRNASITGGRIEVAGSDITRMDEGRLRRFRATEASMVYQDPGAALNPTRRVGDQVIESFTVLGQTKVLATAHAREALARVRIADPDRVMKSYPHQLSGGMQQRVVIAMALASDPRLLILDEPTTGLDATVEANVLDIVRGLRDETDAAILLIAHNLGVIRAMCDQVGVMYAGRIVEEGPVDEVFEDPKHPYTIGLLQCLPRKGLRKVEKSLSTIPGAAPRIGTPLPTCVFVDRCTLADDLCRTSAPPTVAVGTARMSRCHHVDRLVEIAELPAVAGATGARGEEALRLEGVGKTFREGGQEIPALVGVDLSLFDGETLGLVGESGSGKSTLAKAILGIHAPDPGSVIELDGKRLDPVTSDRPAEAKRALQMVFQNPDSALNRSWTVRQILSRSVSKLTGLKGAAVNERVDLLADRLGLTQHHLGVRPRQLSGGLKQRAAIARAFAGNPRIVVADEPTSALDVSVQAVILNQLAALQGLERTSYILISHDLGVVQYLADRIAVLYLGRIQEVGPTEVIFAGPNHPYTEALLSAVPSVDGEARTRIRLDGEIPSPADPPTGCVFQTRCPRKITGLCDLTEPPLVEVEPDHLMRCHIPIDELRRLQSEPEESSS